MRLEKAGTDAKGWHVGPWNSELPIAIGYANEGIDEPHFHTQMTEIYLVAQGEAQLRVEQETLHLQQGDVVVVEQGEAHTFLASSPNYFHFVIHAPCLQESDKVAVNRERLGLSVD